MAKSCKCEINLSPTFKISLIIGVVFVILKVTSVVSWSWWSVLMPFYLIPIIVLCLFLIGSIILFMTRKDPV